MQDSGKRGREASQVWNESDTQRGIEIKSHVVESRLIKIWVKLFGIWLVGQRKTHNCDQQERLACRHMLRAADS